MVNVLQKIFFSFLIAAFLSAGIVAFVFTGVFDINEVISVFPQQVQTLMGIAIFLTLFLIIFFYVNLRQSFTKDDDNPCPVKSGEDEAVELEEFSTGPGGAISILGRFFAFLPGNPEQLQGAEVIYEHDGIHYVNSDAFNGDRNTEREMNNDFAELVESVVNKA